jgi:mRNA interferase MazF
VWLDFAPQAGHEQSGRRPALVLSPITYNRRVGLAVCCPVTGQAKGYPFEVPLPEGIPVSGVVLSDQIRSLDWRARRAQRAAVAPGTVVDEVLAKLLALVS